MIFYVESNFVVELVLRQGESEAAEHILARAEARTLRLAIPAFALIEPGWTLNSHAARRLEVTRMLEREESQLTRSGHRAEFADSLKSVIETFRGLRADDLRNYRKAITRLTQVAIILEIDAEVIEKALDIVREFGLKDFDAIHLAAVIRHVRTEASAEPKYFVSKDRDFDKDELTAVLRNIGCNYVDGYTGALAIQDRNQ